MRDYILKKKKKTNWKVRQFRKVLISDKSVLGRKHTLTHKLRYRLSDCFLKNKIEVPYFNESRDNGSFIVKAVWSMEQIGICVMVACIHMYGTRQAAVFTIVGILKNFDPESVR